ncbi:hypothetical protein ACO0QE_000607 [Hanseniaspora vineae]
MGAYYKVLGAKIPSHFLAIGTYSAVIGGVLSMNKSKPAETDKTPAASAPAISETNTKDEEFDLEKLLGSFLKEETK